MKNLLSVLIVDDELPIRQELNMYDWEQWGTVLIGETENGEDALEFCREYTPDILITDITMPSMNGLELFEEIKKEFPNTQVIILTCHSDFDYARDALRLGAVDYITKVMMEEEIAGALEKARAELKKNLCQQRGAADSLRNEQIQIMREILYNQPEEYQNNTHNKIENLFKKLRFKKLNITFPGRITMLFINTNPQDWLFIRDKIANFLYNYPQKLNWLLADIGQYLLFFAEDISLEKNQQNLVKLLEYLQEKVEINLSFIQNQIDIYGVISDIVNKPVNYKTAFEKLKLWKEIRFYQNENRIYTGYPGIFKSLNKNEISKMEKKMRAVYWEIDKLTEFLNNEFLIWAKRNQIDSTDLKNLVIEWRSEWHRKLDYGGNVEDFAKKIYQSINLSDMVSIMVLDIKAGKGESLRTEIRKARNIVLEQYYKPLTLASVSAEVGLCPNYLSRLFTEEVGESFNDLITRLRLEKACHLLKNSNMKIYQVAEEIGITSYRYFSVIFKNKIGVTPSEYRKG